MPDASSADLTSAHIDRSLLDEFRSEMGDDELVAELIETFFVESAPRIDAMRLASRGGDAPRASAEAHAVKGSAGHFGARELARLCDELEHLDSGAHPDHATDLLGRVAAEFEQVRVQLRSFLLQLG